MMKFLIIYLIGLCISGIAESLLMRYNDNCYNYFVDKINQVKSELPEDQRSLADNFVDNDSIIKYEIFTTSLLSWLGCIVVFFIYIDATYHTL